MATVSIGCLFCTKNQSRTWESRIINNFLAYVIITTWSIFFRNLWSNTPFVTRKIPHQNINSSEPPNLKIKIRRKSNLKIIFLFKSLTQTKASSTYVFFSVRTKRTKKYTNQCFRVQARHIHVSKMLCALNCNSWNQLSFSMFYFSNNFFCDFWTLKSEMFQMWTVLKVFLILKADLGFFYLLHHVKHLVNR
jgi:hypothetical protein